METTVLTRSLYIVIWVRQDKHWLSLSWRCLKCLWRLKYCDYYRSMRPHKLLLSSPLAFLTTFSDFYDSFMFCFEKEKTGLRTDGSSGVRRVQVPRYVVVQWDCQIKMPGMKTKASKICVKKLGHKSSTFFWISSYKKTKKQIHRHISTTVPSTLQQQTRQSTMNPNIRTISTHEKDHLEQALDQTDQKVLSRFPISYNTCTDFNLIDSSLPTKKCIGTIPD